MEALISVIAFVIQFAIGTGVLAGAIFIAGDEALHKESLLKCAGITLLAMVFSLLPFLWWLTIFVWLGGVMVAFEKEFFEAIIIAIACAVINFFLGMALAAVVVAIAGAGAVATGAL